MTIPVVRLYTKPGCHLCELAEGFLEELSRECPLAVEQIDIMTDVDLFERYRYEIPVVAVEGGGSVFGRVTMDDLRRILRLGPPRPAAVPVLSEPLPDLPKPQAQGQS